jgi:serine/threonine-protein kinase ULK/ATG1
VEYFVQILNAFKTLVENNIMHRDLKLANILKHDGTIKIADFGFAKILGDSHITKTMLGSPLNMAPEVLAANEYTNKADIWSIGTCFYEVSSLSMSRVLTPAFIREESVCSVGHSTVADEHQE